MKKIVCFGPGPKFKGGISNYNTSLAKTFANLGECEVHIVSWLQQYPAIIPRDFIDRKSRTDLLENTDITVHYVLNYNKPLSWLKTFRLIKKINPDMVIFQWAIAIQGIPIGYLAKKIKKHTDIEVIFDLHFVFQKESSSIDNYLTKSGIKHADTYIVHSFKTFTELKQLFPKTDFILQEDEVSIKKDKKMVIKLFHPVYNMFKPDASLDTEKLKKEMKLNKYVFLFFGFIRKYKGLHNVIDAFAELVKIRNDVSLLIVGEAFWQTLDNKKLSTKIKKLIFNTVKILFLKNNNQERNYNPLKAIEKYNISDFVHQHIDFVANEDVHKYFQISNALVLFYEYATPSGIESIGYNFNIPILATRVGHFPETIKDGYNGYLAEKNDIQSMTNAMLKAIEKPINRENVSETASEMSWENYAKAILKR